MQPVIGLTPCWRCNSQDFAWPNWRETPQGKFLLSEFARPHDTPWRVAMLHTPLYSRGPHGQLDAAGRPKEKPMRFAREVLEPLLRQAALVRAGSPDPARGS